ncbi:DUF4166 domain-containing protein [Aureimonas phyllosphaerae]|uniref:DUF4166 domain-containing protein n=1 Tax=Aureimonas phyllosphaerae TaxID=1166078 RepID=UPI003A5BD162
MNADPSAYQVVMGAAFADLPGPVRAFHTSRGPHRWVGTASIHRGGGILARMAAAILRFPAAGEAVPVTVTVEPHGAGEVWTRDFDGHVFRSTQWAGVDRGEMLLFERFGPVCVATALVLHAGRLELVQRRAWCLGLPVPRWLPTFGEAFETQGGGSFCFDVTIRAPVIGLVVAYRGHLTEAPTAG